MKFLRTVDLKDGMVVVKPLYRGSQLLLSANHELTKDIINILARTDYPGTYVYDDYSDYDDLSSLIDEELRSKAISAVEDFNIDKIVFLATDFVEELLNKGEDFVLELNNLSLYDSSIYEHSVNTALTSVACGIVLGLSNVELEHLATAAMLHDCGKSGVPVDVLNKKDELTPQERTIMHQHVQYGYDMFYGNYDMHSSIRGAILCHHENWDGSGYLRNLSGESIPLLARIIHVADVYDAIIRQKPNDISVNQSEGIEYLMGASGTKFDFNIVKAFLSCISLYPVGTDVKLSDGRTARVVKNRKNFLERPIVVVGNKVLDLATDRDLFNITIVGTIE